MVLDVVNVFRCQNSGRGIYKLASFTLAHSTVRDVIRKNFHILKNDPEISSIFSNNPLVSFRHSKNIRETLVHSSLPQKFSSPCGTFPCGVGQCKTCKFIDSSTTISAPKFVYHIKHHFTCTSSHLIYCILCSRLCSFTLEKLEDV